MSFRTSEKTKVSKREPNTSRFAFTVRVQPACGPEQTRIEKVQFRRLGDPLQRVREPGLQGRDEKDLFEQGDVALTVCS